MSVVVVMNQLQRLHPDLVVWGVNEAALKPSLDGLNDDAHPWQRPVATEFGAASLYSYVPGLDGRLRALSDEFALNHWALYRYRLYFRHYLTALRKARNRGWNTVFGPYASTQKALDPEGLKAALAENARDAGIGQESIERMRPQVESIVRAVQSMTRAGGGRLVVAWLPTAVDAEAAARSTLRMMADICDRSQIPLIDLRGMVPTSQFYNVTYTAAAGKRKTAQALSPHLQALLGGPSGGAH